MYQLRAKSALGQKQTLWQARTMSALFPKADNAITVHLSYGRVGQLGYEGSIGCLTH